jgi:hypothetical protein
MKVQKRPRKTPTFKERQLVTAYIKHKGNGAKAALEVYDTTKENAKNVAHITLQKPIVQEELKAQLKAVGLDVTELNSKMAKSIELNMVHGKPSQAVAADMIKFAYKLHDVVPSSKHEVKSMNLTKHMIDTPIPDLISLVKKNNLITQKLLDDLS